MRKTMNSAKIINEPVYIHEDGNTVPYIPGHIKTARDGYAASLHLLFKHVADFHITVIDLLAEKYKFSAEEAIDALHADPRFRDMIVHPTIHAMGYFKEEDAKAPTEPVSESIAVPLESAPTHTVPLPESSVPLPKKKRTVVRKKKVEEVAVEPSQDAMAPEQQAKMEELFGPEEEAQEEPKETSENTIPEITKLSAKEIALAKAREKAAAKKKSTTA
jgi:hypothetical protein